MQRFYRMRFDGQGAAMIVRGFLVAVEFVQNSGFQVQCFQVVRFGAQYLIHQGYRALCFAENTVDLTCLSQYFFHWSSVHIRPLNRSPYCLIIAVRASGVKLSGRGWQ